MGTTHHAMPPDEFAALARGGGGAAIGRLVAAQRSRHAILVGAVADLARRGSGSGSAVALAGYELLKQVQRAAPEAADSVISYPSAGAWALHTLLGDQSVPGAQPSGLAGLAAAAAIRAGFAAEIEVPVVNGAVTLPSLGTAEAPGAAGRTAVVRTSPAEVRVDGSRVRVLAGAPGWLDLRPAQADPLRVLIDDLDPFRMPTAGGTPTGRLTPAELTEFTATLQDAAAVLPAASAAEIAAVVRVIVPYQAPPGGLVSTSSSMVFGAVAMSRQPDGYTCAETLVHETQHLKLCALLELVELTKPDDGQRYYAPWRPDPRPAKGLIQGAYAFLGVSGFWREQRWAAPDPLVRERAQAAFARWREGAATVADTLRESGQLTTAGNAFVAEMAKVLGEWRLEPVPDTAALVARHEASRHEARWRADNALTDNAQAGG